MTTVFHRVRPEVFDRAADRIDKYGWVSVTNPSATHPPEAERERLAQLRETEGESFRMCSCIGNTVSALSGGWPGRYFRVLADFLGVPGINEVYRMNDSQPDYATGKAWAVSTLRSVAKLVREEQAK